MAAATEYTIAAQQIYLSYFGRPADRAGLTNLTNALAAANAPTDPVELDAAYSTNPAVKALLNSFGTSGESVALYGGNTSQFVTAIFQNLFNRDPLIGGLDFWTDAIDSGKVTRAQAAHNILTGAIEAGGADASLIELKTTIANNFTTNIDTAAEANGYAGPAAAAAARALLHKVVATTTPAGFQAQVDALLAQLASGPTAPVNQAIALTVGQDILTGGTGADVFTARVAQNQNGEQTNQLASGDVINGGGGTDTLNAKVQMASALNNTPKAPIQPETVSVERVNFTAVSVDNSTAPGAANEVVTINAKEMLGLQLVGSVQSDASLVIQNLTTLTDSGIYAEKRNTDSVTIRMDHTGNDAAVDAESDLTVLFDNDYLVAGTSSSSQATFFLLDEKAELLRLRGDTSSAAARLANINVSGLRFSVTDPAGVTKTLELSDTASWRTNATLGTINSHVKFVAALQDELQILINGGFLPAGTTLTVDTTITDTTGLKDGTISDAIPAIVLKIGGNGYKVTPTGFFQVEEATGSYDVYGVFDAAFAATNLPITSTIQLEKVGRGAEGGDLTVGAMSTNNLNNWNFSTSAKKEGIEKFIVTVSGDATQFSDLASLQSTNNTLTSVNVGWATGSAADLTIGNHNTVGAVANGAVGADNAYSDDDMTSVKNNALKDVREFTATNGTTNVNLFAKVTDESVAKYMNLADNGVNPALDNAAFSYTFGGGNDLLNLNLSKTNLAQSGNSNREDFSFATNTGAGNDTVQTQIGNGVGVATDDWYINSKQNANLSITTGAGNDTVQTYGAGSWNVTLGDGNDVIYSDNSGNQKNVASDFGAVDANGVNFNHGRAVWVLNTRDQATAGAVETRDVNDLETDVNNSNAFLGATLSVTVRGITAKVNVTASNTTDLGLNNLIKQAIQNDVYLSKLIAAQDGPASTLVIRSLVDGVHSANDFTVSLVSNTITTLNAVQLAAFNAANKTTFTTTEQVQTAVNAAVAAWNAASDYDSALGNDLVSNLTGVNSTAATSTIISDGAGNDTIVLSTSGLDMETVNLTNDKQIDVIYNVTNATINGLRAADYTALASTNVGDIISLANGTTLTTWAQILGAGAVLQADGSYSLRVNGGVVVPPVGGTAVTLTAGSSAPVVAAVAAETFSFNVAAAKALTANTQIEISGFNATLDKLSIDTTTALGSVKLAALNGVDGISVQSSLITNSTLVNFGPDANGDIITITLAGVTDASLVNITVI